MKKVEYILIPLIEMGNLKLDEDGLRRALLNDRGQGSTAWQNFNLDTYSADFDEKDKTQVYDLSFELWAKKRNPIYVVGQGGLFLKSDKLNSCENVNKVISESKNFIEFCKAFLFKPVALAHLQDGDCYLSIDEYSRSARLFENVEVLEE